MEASTKCAEILFVSESEKFPIICYSCQEIFSEILVFKEHYLNKHFWINEKDDQDLVSSDLTITNISLKAEDCDGSKSENIDDETCTDSQRSEDLKEEVDRGQSNLIVKQEHSSDEDRSCNVSEKSFDQQVPLKLVKKESDCVTSEANFLDQQYICENPKCDSSFTTPDGLSTHKLQYHPNDPERPFKCNQCLKGFLCYGSLNAHTKTVHLKTRIRFKCQFCTRSFNIKEKKDNHEATHNGVKAYECDHCKKRFCKKQQLQLHIRRNHLREKRFQCNFCEKDFFDAGEKRKHERTHTGEKPFVCEICSEAFTVGQKLRNHMAAKHSNNPEFQCDQCEKRFFIKDNYKRHRLLHKGDKSFMCEICSKAFYRNRELQTHMQVHKNYNTQYNCKNCEKIFTNRHEFRSHIKLHNDGKPTNLCEFCSEPFEQLKELRKHVKSYHKDLGKEHKCKKCSEVIYSREEYKSHLLTHRRQKKSYSCKKCNHLSQSTIEHKEHMKNHPKNQKKDKKKNTLNDRKNEEIKIEVKETNSIKEENYPIFHWML